MSCATKHLFALLGFALAVPATAQEYSDLHRMIPAKRFAAQSMRLGDLDGDGDLDLYAGYQFNTTDKILLWADDTGFTELVGAAPASDGVGEVALGDVDGDSDVDVYVVDGNQNELYLNDGTGMMTLAPDALPTLDDNSLSVELGDFDQDGDLDAIVGEHAFTVNQIVINNGATWNLQFPGPFGLLDLTNDVEVADVDKNGALDIITANGSLFAEPNRLYLNAGGASFTESVGVFDDFPMDWSNEIAVGDANGDTNVDVVFGNNGFGGGGVDRLFLGDGTGNFSGASLPVFRATRDIELADVDGDTDLDVIVMAENSGQEDVLLLNDGSASWTDASAQLGSGFDIAWDMDVDDIDQDGDVDVVIGVTGPSDRLLMNDGSGVFTDVTNPGMPEDRDLTEDVALADVDGDGDLDAYLANYLNDSVDRLWENIGSGVFVDATANLPVLDPVPDSHGVAFGDWDGDGDQDLLVANEGKNRAYRNDGTGVFSYAPGDTPSDLLDTYDVVTGDLDGDGDTDAVVANDGFWDQVYLNDGSGDFSNSILSLPQDSLATQSLALGDLDGDGDLDLARGFRSNTSDDALLNDGSAIFSAAPTLTTNTNFTFAMAMLDVEPDGDADVLIGKSNGDELRRSNLPVGFEAGAGLPQINAFTKGFAIEDMDGDGDPDVVAAVDEFTLTNILYRNEGGGVFSDASSVFTPEVDDSTCVAVGDLDGDGDPDILIGNQEQSRVLFELGPQLAWGAVPRIGKLTTFDLYADPNDGWLLALSLGTGSLPLPGGELLIDPSSFLIAGSGLLDGNGRGSISFPVVASPVLIGFTIYWQAAFGPGSELSNLEATTLTGL